MMSTLRISTTEIAAPKPKRRQPKTISAAEKQTEEERQQRIEEEFDEMDRQFLADQLVRGVSDPLSFRDVVALSKEARADMYEERQKNAACC